MILILALLASAFVFVDGRTRLSRAITAVWTLATFVTAGLAAALYLLARPSRNSSWGLGEVAALPLFFVLAVAPSAMILETFALRVGIFSSLGVIVALTVLQNAVFVGASLYVVLVKYRLPPDRIGLVSPAAPRMLALAAIASATALAGNFVGQNLTVFGAGLVVGQKAAADLVVRQEIRLPVFHMLQQFRHPVDIATLAVLVGLVVPVGEEIFFRGLTYGALRRMMGRPLAIVVSALFFAVAHLEPVEFLPILILGMILAALYEYNKSLIPCMITHAVNNLAALALFYLAPPVS
ncbi:MAG TPA: type II CAAX endopeptidase family protein [bacterium]|nr:type II CAAX endopeptidase family protein [bacterium]